MEKSNKKLDIIFDECLDGMLTGQVTLEQCLKKYPDQAAELEPLLRTALSVNNAVAIQPSPEAKSRGRYQLQLKMAQAGKPRRSPIFGWQPRWAVAVMTVMLVFTLGGGTVLAADSSMPGSPLYPVKIATENVRVKLARSDVQKEAILATCADRRVAEIAHVVAKGNVDTQRLESVAARYISQVDRMSGMMTAGDQTVTVTGGMGMMTATATQPAAAPQPEATTPPALAATRKPADKTEKAQSQESTPPQATANQQDDEIEQLKVRIIAYGISHPGQIEKLLNDPKVPEQAKYALRRMLQDAREKYPQAIKNLENQQKSSGKNRGGD